MSYTGVFRTEGKLLATASTIIRRQGVGADAVRWRAGCYLRLRDLRIGRSGAVLTITPAMPPSLEPPKHTLTRR